MMNHKDNLTFSLEPPDQEKLLDLVILKAYESFRGLSAEEELCAEILRRELPPTLDLDRIRADARNSDLDQQLRILEKYIRGALEDPYRGDMGMGGSRFMPIRYENRGRFGQVARAIFPSGVSMYVHLWRVVLGPLLPDCDEERQSSLPRALTKPEERSRSEAEVEILSEKYPEFYQLMADPAALEKCLEGLLQVSGIDHIPAKLEPTCSLYEAFWIDSLESCELLDWYSDAFQFSEKDVSPKNSTVGEWARIIMTYRTV
jgi:hypothetical protein